MSNGATNESRNRRIKTSQKEAVLFFFRIGMKKTGRSKFYANHVNLILTLETSWLTSSQKAQSWNGPRLVPDSPSPKLSSHFKSQIIRESPGLNWDQVRRLWS